MEETGSESTSGDHDKSSKRRRRYNQKRWSVVNPDENFYFRWLFVLTVCILYNFWTLIVRQSFPELQVISIFDRFSICMRLLAIDLPNQYCLNHFILHWNPFRFNFITFFVFCLFFLQNKIPSYWFSCDCFTDIVFVLDIVVQLRTGYLEQGLMVSHFYLMFNSCSNENVFVNILHFVAWMRKYISMNAKSFMFVYIGKSDTKQIRSNNNREKRRNEKNALSSAFCQRYLVIHAIN